MFTVAIVWLSAMMWWDCLQSESWSLLSFHCCCGCGDALRFPQFWFFLLHSRALKPFSDCRVGHSKLRGFVCWCIATIFTISWSSQYRVTGSVVSYVCCLECGCRGWAHATSWSVSSEGSPVIPVSTMWGMVSGVGSAYLPVVNGDCGHPVYLSYWWLWHELQWASSSLAVLCLSPCVGLPVTRFL